MNILALVVILTLPLWLPVTLLVMFCTVPGRQRLSQFFDDLHESGKCS